MKKIVLSFLIMLPVSLLHAQKIFRKDTLSPIWKNKEFLMTDSFFANRMGQPFIQRVPMVKKLKPGKGNSMPNSLPVTGFNNDEYHFLLNNKNGFDVYESGRDGMLILKPDSIFVSNMPIVGDDKK